MKFFSKINRGFILTAAVVIAVVIYLVAQSMSQAELKPKVKDVCEKFINTSVSYKQLPDQYKKENPEIPKAELDKYIDNMTRDLKAFYKDNEQTYKFAIESNKSYLENQASGMGVVYDYEKTVKEFKNFDFNGDTVTVTVLTNTVFDGPDVFTPGAPRANIAGDTTDTITLQQTDGKWKVIYADLQQPVKNQGNNGGVIYRTSGY